MTYGVKINGYDTKEEWDLILLDDLTIEAPAPNFNLVTVPGVNGAYDFSNILGGVTYQMRTISFSLFTRLNDIDLRAIRDELADRFHGQRVELVLPDDPAHRYEGRMSIGGVDGYNTGRIAVTMIADPVAYSEVTE